MMPRTNAPHMNSNGDCGTGTEYGLRYEEEVTLASTGDYGSGSGSGSCSRSGSGSSSGHSSPAVRLRPVLRPRTGSESGSETELYDDDVDVDVDGNGVDIPLQPSLSSPESPSFRESLRYFQQKIDIISNRQSLIIGSTSNVKPWEQVGERYNIIAQP